MATLEVTKDTFESTISDNDIVVVDYWAPWCGPCVNFAPTYEAASEKHVDIVFAKVNTEEEQELAAAFQIRSIPTLTIFREQVIMYSEAGVLTAGQFDELLEKVKSVDMAEVHKEVAAQQTPQA